MPTAPDPLFVAFGDALRTFRKGRGWSQETLAERAQLHRSYVTEIELGRRNVSLYNIRRLAVALGISMAELVDATERREKPGSGTGSA